MKRILSFAAVFLIASVFLPSKPFAQQQECKGFRSQTQGGWGADPHGNNPGVYLQNNFAGVFPSGLTIGCATGNQLVLTSSSTVNAFLPSGTTPSLLPAGTLTDPGGSYSNVLAGQLVTAVLNLGFDLYDPNFSSNTIHTGDLVITSGTFKGWTINQLIAEANSTIGGCSNTYSASDLNDALTSFNENYDNGTVDNGFTTCTAVCDIAVDGIVTDVSCYGGNSGAIDITATSSNSTISYLWNDGSTSEDRTALTAGNYSVTVSDVAGCKASASFTVSQPLYPLIIKKSILPVSGLNTCDGAARIKVKGGTAPYTVVWNDGYIGAARKDLCKGTYTVTATDAKGCVAVCTLKIKCAVTSMQITSITSSSLIRKDDVSIAASPNPTKGLVKLSVNAAASGSAIVNVYDMTGKKMSSEKFVVSPGTNIKTIDLSKYAKGFYNVEMIIGNGKRFVKVMVQ